MCFIYFVHSISRFSNVSSPPELVPREEKESETNHKPKLNGSNRIGKPMVLLCLRQKDRFERDARTTSYV